MDWLFDEPAVVLVLVALAAILLVIEDALPTLGIAGTLGLRPPLEPSSPYRVMT